MLTLLPCWQNKSMPQALLETKISIKGIDVTLPLLCPGSCPFHGTGEENQDIIDRLRERKILPWIKLASLSSLRLNPYSTRVQIGPLRLFIRRQQSSELPGSRYSHLHSQEIVLLLSTA